MKMGLLHVPVCFDVIDDSCVALVINHVVILDETQLNLLPEANSINCQHVVSSVKCNVATCNRKRVKSIKPRQSTLQTFSLFPHFSWVPFCTRLTCTSSNQPDTLAVDWFQKPTCIDECMSLSPCPQRAHMWKCNQDTLRVR